MIGGEAATRIMMEVLKGVLLSASDTLEEAAYRAQVKAEIDEIHASGGEVEMPREWL